MNFAPKYDCVVAAKAVKPLVFMYHEAMGIILGSKNVKCHRFNIFLGF